MRTHLAHKPRRIEALSTGQVCVLVAIVAAAAYVIAAACVGPGSRALHTLDLLAFQAFRWLAWWGFRAKDPTFVIVYVFGTVQWFTVAFAWTWMALSLRRSWVRRRVRA